MENELLTSKEAARLLGVGTTTIKRWADAGVLSCIKTAGKHRRFSRSEVTRLLQAQVTAPPQDSEPLSSLIRVLTGEGLPHDVQAELYAVRAKLGAWWRVADSVGAALETLGKLWEEGRLTILEEHVASERLARALARVNESLPARRNPPRCLLAVPEGEEHTLGLALSELTAREAGWTARWAGRATPIAEIIHVVRARQVELVLLSASRASLTASELERTLLPLAEECHGAGVLLVVGGSGDWPEPPAGTRRLRTFAQLHHLLDEARPASP